MTADRNPDRTDMHRAYAAWRAREKPSIWHPLYTNPSHRISLPVRWGSAPVKLGDPISVLTMHVILYSHRTADQLIGCIVGFLDLPDRHIAAVLDGPFRIDGTFRQPPAYDDVDLWWPDNTTFRHELGANGGIKLVPYVGGRDWLLIERRYS